MFNLYPGHGLGFTGSQELAFGLNPVFSQVVIVPMDSASVIFSKFDNLYTKRNDDNEVIEIITLFLTLI